MDDSIVNSVWAERACKGYWGSSFVNEKIEAWRSRMTWPRTHNWLMSGLVFQTGWMSFCAFSSWNLVLLCFLSLLTEHSEKVKERTQIGRGLQLICLQQPSNSRWISVVRWIVYKYESSQDLLEQFLVWLHHESNHSRFESVRCLLLAPAFRLIENRIRVEAKNKCQQQKLYHMFHIKTLLCILIFRYWKWTISYTRGSY